MLFGYLFFALITGFWASNAAKRGDGFSLGWFLIGFLCNLLGVLIAYVARPALKTSFDTYDSIGRLKELEEKGVIDEATFYFERDKLLGVRGRQAKGILPSDVFIFIIIASILWYAFSR